MKKKIAIIGAIFLSVCMIVGGVAFAFVGKDADSGAVNALELLDFSISYDEVNGTATVEGYDGDGADMTIPAKIEKESRVYTVTAIANSAFYDDNVASLDLPSTVSYIGSTFVDVESAIASAEGGAANTTGLTKTVYGGGWYLGNSSNRYMILYNVPDKGITSFSIHTSCQLIYYAFADCDKLQSISIPSSVVTLDDGAFKNCRSLSAITIPSSVTRLGAQAFSYCTNINTLNWHNNISTIGRGCFEGCGQLSSVTLPTQLGTLEAEVFCCAFENGGTITIPASVTNLKSGSLAVSGGVTFVFQASTPPTQNAGMPRTENIKIKVPSANLNAYKSAWSLYTNFIVAN